MKISGTIDERLMDSLCEQIRNVIEATDKANPEISQNEIVWALAINLAEVLLNIDCPDCRRLNKRAIEKIVPQALRGAMLQAAQSPQSSDHVH